MQWLLDEVKKRAQEATDYETRSQYNGLLHYLEKLAQRFETAEGELDGKTWDHEGWDE